MSKACLTFASNSLLDKRYDEVTWISAHNAHAADDLTSIDGISANQTERMDILIKKFGVRSLLIDIVYKKDDGKIMLTHGTGGVFTEDHTGEFVERMKKEVLPFLKKNPSAILTFDIEVPDADRLTKAQFKAAMDKMPEIKKMLFNPTDTKWENHKNWPTLRELIKANQRIIMFIDRGHLDEGYDDFFIMKRNFITIETHFEDYSHDKCDRRSSDQDFTFTTVDQASGVNSKWSRLFTMNHFYTANGIDIFGRTSNTDSVNSWDGLFPRIELCVNKTKMKKFPNFIPVDYVEKGDLVEITETLNYGGIIFYEGNNATKDIVCGLSVGRNRTIKRGDKGCSNDDARSAKLVNVPAGTKFRVYDSPDGDYDDDWAEVEVLKDIGKQGYVLKHFQQGYTDSKIRISYYGDDIGEPNSNKLNGKISRWEIWAAN